MATLNLTYSSLNISCKVGDTAYFVNETDTVGGFNVGGGIELIGNVNSISGNTINVELEGENANIDNIQQNITYIFFSKNNLVEIGSILGYYAQCTFKNNSTEKAELYATSCEVEESSK